MLHFLSCMKPLAAPEQIYALEGGIENGTPKVQSAGTYVIFGVCALGFSAKSPTVTTVSPICFGRISNVSLLTKIQRINWYAESWTKTI